MKYIFVLLVLMLFSFSTFSQWCGVAGFNMSTITGSKGYKYKPSVHVGLTYDFELSKKMYFQPGLLFSSTGAVLKENMYFGGGHVKIYAIELPLVFSFRPTVGEGQKLLFDFGFYTRCGLWGNKTYDYYDLPRVDESPFNSFRRFESGLSFGLGIQKNRYSCLLGFQQGFTNAEKSEGFYHQLVKLSLGYRF